MIETGTGVIEYVEKGKGFIPFSAIRTACDPSPVRRALEKEGCTGFFVTNVTHDGRPVPLEAGLEISFPITCNDETGEFTLGEVTVAGNSRMELSTGGGVILTMQALDGSRTLEHAAPFVSWTLSPELAEQAKRIMLEGREVKMLLIHYKRAGHHSGNSRGMEREYRQLVPVTDPMACLPFSSSGNHNIVAMVVCSNTQKSLRDIYLTRFGSKDWQTDVLAHDQSYITLSRKRGDGLGIWFGSGFATEGLLAKKPRDWGWLNWMLKPPADECGIRRRRMFAYTVQPMLWILWKMLQGAFLGALWCINLAFTIVLLLAGARGVNYKPLLFTWGEMAPTDVCRLVNGSIFVPTIRGVRAFPLLCFSPLCIIAVTAILSWWTGDSIPEAAMIGIRRLTGMFLWLSLGSLAIVLFPALVKTYHALFPASTKEAASARKAREEREMDALLAPLLRTPKKPSAWELPFKLNHFRFFYHGAKQTVCRPLENE